MKKTLLKIRYLALSGILFPLVSFAYDFNEDSGLNASANKSGYEDLKQLEPEEMLTRGITFALAFVGVLFLILMIAGGFKWMTARGNETEVEKAKTMVFRGVIGVLIVLSAYIISYFVINFFGASFLK